MKTTARKCLKCDRPIPASRWLCPACRQENRSYALEAEGVVDLYGDED